MSQTITKTYEIFKFDELSEKAKDQAISQMSDINVDVDWWDYDGHTAFSSDEMKKYHLTIEEAGDLLEFKHMYFDIDRGSYIQFADCSFANDKQARKFLGITPRLWNMIDVSFNDAGRGSNTRLEIEQCDYDSNLTEHDEMLIERAKERFNDKMEDCLSNLRKQYDYLTGREAIEETIEANEYTFDENGYRKD